MFDLVEVEDVGELNGVVENEKWLLVEEGCEG